MMKLVVKKNHCTGCMLCESACSLFHEGVANLERARVQIARGEALSHNYGINICRQCKVCPPIDACPVRAISRDGEHGAIIINYDACLPGCSICVAACHLDAIFQAGGGKPVVCDLCGGDPQCVKMCEPLALGITEVRMAAAN
ncbi:MAG: 4Fe-4S dicluster domain-containing protein [Candidatus Tectomicrobia bacterium]|nr:4Fe-4S dicluster domain-containing protein [Candidatus Tectomicrobia bacterium]